jgi:uroporphyrin-III C-methyltransferase
VITWHKDPKEPLAFIARGTTLEERFVVCTLEELAKEPPDVKPPTVMMVGKVVELRKISKIKHLSA